MKRKIRKMSKSKSKIKIRGVRVCPNSYSESFSYSSSYSSSSSYSYSSLRTGRRPDALEAGGFVFHAPCEAI